MESDRPAKNVKCCVIACKTAAETFIQSGKDKLPVCGFHAALYRAQAHKKGKR